jgi:hypothetical protein
MKKYKKILPSGRGRASHKEPQHGKGGIQARIWLSPWLLDRAGDMGLVDERPVTHSVPSVIPAKVNPVRKALITAVTKTTTDIFQAADEITPLTLVAAARVRAARG